MSSDARYSEVLPLITDVLSLLLLGADVFRNFGPLHPLTDSSKGLQPLHAIRFVLVELLSESVWIFTAYSHLFLLIFVCFVV